MSGLSSRNRYNWRWLSGPVAHVDVCDRVGMRDQRADITLINMLILPPVPCAGAASRNVPTYTVFSPDRSKAVNLRTVRLAVNGPASLKPPWIRAPLPSPPLPPLSSPLLPSLPEPHPEEVHVAGEPRSPGDPNTPDKSRPLRLRPTPNTLFITRHADGHPTIQRTSDAQQTPPPPPPGSADPCSEQPPPRPSIKGRSLDVETLEGGWHQIER